MLRLLNYSLLGYSALVSCVSLGFVLFIVPVLFDDIRIFFFLWHLIKTMMCVNVVYQVNCQFLEI